MLDSKEVGGDVCGLSVSSDDRGSRQGEGDRVLPRRAGFKLVDANQPGATFACGGGTFLEIYPSEFAGTAKNTVAGFEVPDLEKAISELRSRGVSFEEYESPKTIDGIAHLGPNRGAWFADLTEMPRARSAVRRSRGATRPASRYDSI